MIARVRPRLATLLALAALLALLVLFLLPPRPRPSLAAPDGTLAAPATARGAFHVHTNRSDGTGSVDEVATAAARAGLQFLVLTDHGDGTRAPLPPALHHGVLVVDGVEISTSGGHYVALGLPGPAPYPLAGEPRDVVEDVRRLGGIGIAAHPDSPKPALRWTGWDEAFDGLEWLNADSEWRDESRGTLLRALATYPWRPAETLGALLSHARTVLGRWDDRARVRRTVGLAGVDAHARIGLRDGPDPYGGRVLAKVPSYESSFRTFALHVELDAPLTGDPARDGAALIAALRDGHTYTTLDALGVPASVGFVATSGDRRARMGDFLPPAAFAPASVPASASASASAPAPAPAPVEWRASVAAPAGATLRLVCDGAVATEVPATNRLAWRHEAGSLPAACRLESGWEERGRRVTWLVTNPIYLRAADPPLPPASTAATAAPAAVERSTDDFTAPNAWLIEADPQSKASWRALPAAPAPSAAATTSAIGATLELTYALRAGGRFSQYAAFVTPPHVGWIGRATRVSFRGSADKPMRISVQVRRPLERPGDGERWQRSVYLDATPRDVSVRFDDMRPIFPARTPQPPLAQVHAFLLVVDTDNSAPGRAGTIRIEDLRFER